MRHFCGGGWSGLPVFTLRVGAPVATGLVVRFPLGVCAPPRHVPLGEGCSRSALPPWGWEAGGTDPGEPAFSQTLVTRSAPQGRGAGPPQPGHGRGHSLGTKAARTLTPDPAEGPLSPEWPCTCRLSRHGSRHPSAWPPRPGPRPIPWDPPHFSGGKPRPPGEDPRPLGGGLAPLLADRQPPPASLVITLSW